MEELINGILVIIGGAGALLLWAGVLVVIVLLIEMLGVGKKSE